MLIEAHRTLTSSGRRNLSRSNWNRTLEVWVVVSQQLWQVTSWFFTNQREVELAAWDGRLPLLRAVSFRDGDVSHSGQQMPNIFIQPLTRASVIWDAVCHRSAEFGDNRYMCTGTATTKAKKKNKTNKNTSNCIRRTFNYWGGRCQKRSMISQNNAGIIMKSKCTQFVSILGLQCITVSVHQESNIHTVVRKRNLPFQDRYTVFIWKFRTEVMDTQMMSKSTISLK